VPLLDQPERSVPPAMAAEQVATAERAVLARALRAAMVAKVATAEPSISRSPGLQSAHSQRDTLTK